ncbi:MULTISPECIES: FHA domain-containing protein [unclassified Leifsonia]|uniref:FHA domain-containing protein n=1 Tax=unclassified Leifsonia TaxID=2663824 RepID=UPI0008A753A8|nr:MULTISPECIES: FHA domain-containing protein [unclassified Leifsonia]SEH87237.1 FHA domain-containing protein [Leifsonia sp. CL154]SFL49560.1 FHA domain-containing protein [Leifsonia sp. CL147]
MTGGFVRYAPTAGPSRWLLVAGRRFVAAVESTASDQIVDAVYWLADSDLATIESVVGAFPLAGPDSVRSFAVAEIGEPNAAGEVTVTAVVRGGAAIDVFSVGGSRRFSAGGVQPWVLAEFRAVNGLVLQGDDAATGPVARLAVDSLPLRVGVADGELLTWTLKPIERAARGGSPAAQPAAAGGTAEGGAAEADAAVDETIIRGRNPSSSLFGGRATAEGEEDVRPAAHPAPHELAGAVDIEEPPVARSGSAVPAGDTPSVSAGRLLIDTGDLLPSTQPLVPPAAPATFAARLPSGDSVALDVPLVIGRRPAPQRVASGAGPRLVTVPSPTQEVSSTHVRIEQSGDAVVVTDLRSTNGTVVTGPGGARRLRPGESAVVLAGARVEIGDGNIIEITEAPEEGRE